MQVHLSTEHTGEDGAVERQQLTAKGDGWLHSDQWVVRFVEQETGRDPVMTTIKAKEHQLTLIRRGGVTMRQVFDPAMETRGRYEHPYGQLEMITKTEHLHRSKRKEGWRMEWVYHLHLNGVEAGTFHITLTVKPEKME